ncbi:MAG: hypothetical protein HZA18_04675 [Nitrospirae bacterium]|nr:hypothetical protein [Nitrospirota bacterium]
MRPNVPVLVKITRPVYSRIFPRKRLFRLVDRALKKPIVWICGPPGSGKTILASSYIEARSLPYLWYRVDSGDADVATFFYYMGLADKKAAPYRKKGLPLLTPEYMPGLPTFSRRYFEDLYSRMKKPSCIVFDNYHEAPFGSLFHEVIREGMEVIPEGVSIIFISRSEAPPALSRSLVNHSVEMIGWDDLQLTPEESLGIMRLRCKERPSKEVVRDIQSQTKGWAARLALMLERGGKGEGKPGFLKVKTLDRVFDYFASKVMERLDGDTRSFLLKTSILPHMDLHLARELTGVKNSEQILDDLSRRNCFTDKHFYSNPVYQYHPLFREFLLSRARNSFSSAKMRQLQSKAAELLDEHSQFEDAYALFHDSSDWDGITQLVMKHAQALVMQGRGKTLEEWIISIPEDLLNKTPWLLYWIGVCRMPFNPLRSRSHLELALQLFDEQKDATGVFLAWSSIVETFIWAWDDFTPLEHWIEMLYLLLDKYKATPSQDIEFRVAANMFNAMSHHMPHHPDISLWERRAKKVMRNSPDNNLRILTGTFLFQYYSWLGDRDRAMMLNDELRPLIQSSEIAPLQQIMWCTQEAIFGWLMDSAEGCLSAVNRGLELAKTSGVHIYDPILYAQGIYGCISMGDYEAASDYLKKINVPALRHIPLYLSHYYFLAAIIALGKGDIRYAIEQGEAALEINGERGMPFAQAITRIALANAYIAIGRYDTAMNHITDAFTIGHSMKSKNLAFMCSVTNAYMCMMNGDEKECLKLVRNAMTIARKNEIVNIFYTRRPVMAGLCARALEAGIEVEHIKKIIKRNNLVPDTPTQHIESWPWPIRIYTLGRFMILIDDSPVKFSRKMPKMTLELLKALIALGGRDVDEEDLTDLLWPDADGDGAHRVFETTLCRLRKLLGFEKAIELRGARLTIDSSHCWIDLWAFERLIGELNKEVNSGYTEKTTLLFEKAISLYQGGFLAGDEDNPRCASTRERLRDQLTRHICGMGRYLEQSGELKKALDCFKKGLEVDDLHEAFYRQLMVCYQRLGRRAEAISIYNRLKKRFSDSLGIEPAQKTEAIYQAILLG